MRASLIKLTLPLLLTSASSMAGIVPGCLSEMVTMTGAPGVVLFDTVKFAVSSYVCIHQTSTAIRYATERVSYGYFPSV